MRRVFILLFLLSILLTSYSHRHEFMNRGKGMIACIGKEQMNLQKSKPIASSDSTGIGNQNALADISSKRRMKNVIKVEDSYSNTPRINSTWDPDGEDCSLPATNCFKTAMTKPRETEFESLDLALASGQQSLKKFFNTEKGITYTKYFGYKYYQLLQAGTYTILKEEGKNKMQSYYLLGPALTLNSENAVFVLTVFR